MEAKVSIKQNWQDLVKLATTNENDNFDEFNELEIKSSNRFQKTISWRLCIYSNRKHYKCWTHNWQWWTSLTIAPTWKPFGLFHNKHYEK